MIVLLLTYRFFENDLIRKVVELLRGDFLASNLVDAANFDVPEIVVAKRFWGMDYKINVVITIIIRQWAKLEVLGIFRNRLHQYFNQLTI